MILNLQKKIESWVEQGLLTQPQAEKILAAENKGESRSWVLYGIAGIGITAIAIGIVSVIAANWQEVPWFAKIAGYLLLHSAAGYWVWVTLPKPSAWREAALLLFSLMFYAGIGLYAQVFQLSGPAWRTSLFWVALTSGCALLTRGRVLSYLWVLSLNQTIFVWAVERRIGGVEDKLALSFAISVPILTCAFGLWGYRFPVLATLRKASIELGFMAVMVFGSICGNIAWQTGRAMPREDLPYLLLPWAALFLAIFASVTRGRWAPKNLQVITAALLLFMGTYITVPLFLDNHGGLFYRVVGAAGFFTVWGLAAASAALGNFRRLFDACSVIIATRFLMVYFEVFGTLAMTGMGLIFSGMLILGVAYGWYRYRGLLHDKVGVKS